MTDPRANALHWQLPADHPVFAGHFPGQPIIPGALLLDKVTQAVAGHLEQPEALVRIDSAKFLHPAGPADAIRITLTPSSGGSDWRFALRVGERTIASGAASIRTEPEAGDE